MFNIYERVIQLPNTSNIEIWLIIRFHISADINIRNFQSASGIISSRRIEDDAEKIITQIDIGFHDGSFLNVEKFRESARSNNAF